MRMSRILKSIVVLMAAVLWLAAAGCSDRSRQKPQVTVSILPQKYIVDRIAGDRVEVRALLSAGANPENYEPGMAHMMNLERSKLYLRMGNLAFEDAIIEKIKLQRPDLKIADMSEGIELITGTHGDQARSGAIPPPIEAHEADSAGTAHHHDHHGHDHAHAADPHVWSSTANARIMAANALKALTDIDPAGGSVYRKNYDNFMAHLDSLDNEIRALLAKTPRPVSFIIWHPSLSYFSRDYGLRQISLSPEGKEMSVSQLKAQVDSARGAGSPVLLLQRDFDTRQAEVLNREIGARIVYINPLNEDWEAELLHTARAITGAADE